MRYVCRYDYNNLFFDKFRGCFNRYFIILRYIFRLLGCLEVFLDNVDEI